MNSQNRILKTRAWANMSLFEHIEFYRNEILGSVKLSKA